MTKTQKVLEHLQNDKSHSITSLEAIRRYNATRLSGIIYNLRKRGYDIVTYDASTYDEDGRRIPYGIYILKNEEG